MAIPKVFVSSTCYDLKYIRENLKYFINNIGYEPILSEDGDVFYDPDKHTHDSCLSEINLCQIFVLIIGGRFGGKYINGDKSITNMEYETAKKTRIPIFALVDSSTYSSHHVYTENKKNVKVNENDIKYPGVDRVEIFDFIDEVRRSSVNNAIQPFQNYIDIEHYLKKQWAALLYNYLASDAESKRVEQVLEQIHTATDKIEFYTKQVAQTVGDKNTKLFINIYNTMLDSDVTAYMRNWRIKFDPQTVIENETIDDLCNNDIIILDDNDNATFIHGGPPYRLSEYTYVNLVHDYTKLRNKLINQIKEEGLTEQEFISMATS